MQSGCRLPPRDVAGSETDLLLHAIDDVPHPPKQLGRVFGKADSKVRLRPGKRRVGRQRSEHSLPVVSRFRRRDLGHLSSKRVLGISIFSLDKESSRIELWSCQLL